MFNKEDKFDDKKDGKEAIMAENQRKKLDLFYENEVNLKVLPNEESNDDCLYLAPDSFEQDPEKIEQMAKRVNKALNNILST